MDLCQELYCMKIHQLVISESQNIWNLQIVATDDLNIVLYLISLADFCDI